MNYADLVERPFELVNSVLRRIGAPHFSLFAVVLSCPTL